MAKSKAKSNAKSNFDFKGLLLQRGERIGLYSAAAVAGLLILLAMWSFASSGSPTEMAKPLIEASAMVERATQDPNNQPTDADKPPPAAVDKIVTLSKDAVDGKDYRLALLIPPKEAFINGRREPKVLAIEEGIAGLARVQLKTYMIVPGDPPKLVMFVNEDGAGTGKGGMQPKGSLGPKFGGSSSGAMGGGMTGGGMTGGGPMRGGNPFGPGGNYGGTGKMHRKVKRELPNSLKTQVKFGEEGGPKGRLSRLVPLNDVEKQTDKTPGTQVRPLRMVVVAASFPYRRQLEEFRTRLGLATIEEVLTEGVKNIDPKGKVQFAFRFAGVEVQRRELDLDGNPVAIRPKDGGQPTDDEKAGWADVDIYADYRPFVAAAGREFEPEDPALEAVSNIGLVMSKLATSRSGTAAAEEGGGMSKGMGGSSLGPIGGKGPPDMKKEEKGKAVTAEDQYPAIEKKLPLLAATLKTLEEKPAEEVRKPSKYHQDDAFDPFSNGRGASSENEKEKDNPMAMPRMPGSRGPTGEGIEKVKPKVVPEHCLVRIIDVAVQPGKTYEYRLRVRMANPNFKKDTEVASIRYAREELLPEGPWSDLKGDSRIIARVDPELTYYAINQEQVDKQHGVSPYKMTDRYARDIQTGSIPYDRAMFFQAQMWLKEIPRRELPVGEWVAAERMLVYRGEYVGSEMRVEVPYWRPDLDEFVIATDSRASKDKPSALVNFGYGAGSQQPEAILVDFENGKVGYPHAVPGAEDKDKGEGEVKGKGKAADAKPVVDSSAGEALLMLPDGRLILRETAADQADAARAARLKKIKERVKDVKAQGKDEEETKDKDKKGRKDKGKLGD